MKITAIQPWNKYLAVSTDSGQLILIETNELNKQTGKDWLQFHVIEVGRIQGVK